jgi:hypothetical protein
VGGIEAASAERHEQAVWLVRELRLPLGLRDPLGAARASGP